MNYFTYRCLRLIHVVRTWLFQQLTPTGFGVLAGLAIAAIAGLGSTQSMIHLLFFFSLALFMLSAIGVRFIQYSFRATRTLPRFGTVGEPLQYQVTIQNLTPIAQRGLQFGEAFSDCFPSFQDFTRIKARYPVGSQWMQQWRQHIARQQSAIAHPQDLPILLSETKAKVLGEVLPLRRGRLSFEAIALACPDPLGLVYKRQTYELAQSVCILPQRYRLPPMNLPRARRYQMGEHSSVASIGEALEFRSLRDYRPGDPTNKIHWKSWAKVGRPIVKEQQDESAVHHALILDTFQPDADSEIFEAAIAVAISFLLQEQPEESLLDVVFADPQVRCVTVRRGFRQRAQILETIATLGPCQDRDLDVLAPMLQSRLPRLSGCFCIFLNLDATRFAFLKTLAQSGVPIKAIFLCEQKVFQPESFDDALPSQCRTHLVSVDNMQQDLLSI
jgi:uncharacterized protein (DUF58 family)